VKLAVAAAMACCEAVYSFEVLFRTVALDDDRTLLPHNSDYVAAVVPYAGSIHYHRRWLQSSVLRR